MPPREARVLARNVADQATKRPRDQAKRLLKPFLLVALSLCLSVAVFLKGAWAAVTDPTKRPVANGQLPASGSYGRNLAAGKTYIDPNTGVTVLKMTDINTPTSGNAGMVHGYSEGGPTISQPWQGTDGNTYYTAHVGYWLVDVRYDTSTITTSNWRRVSAGEVALAFSLNPATPRIAYIVDGNVCCKTVNRYNTAANQVENT